MATPSSCAIERCASAWRLADVYPSSSLWSPSSEHFFTARDAFVAPSCGKSAAFLDSVSLSELRTAELCADVLAGAASGDSAVTH